VLWKPKIELTLDCFLCERVGRTVILEGGEERALCTSDQKRGPHPTAARIAGFDTETWDRRPRVRAVVDYWRAPFHDARRDAPAMPLTRTPWVRLHFDVRCQASRERVAASTQTNLLRPAVTKCGQCGEPVATSTDAPYMRLL
jgi:hypothetical protein